jgi:hypothetical protein
MPIKAWVYGADNVVSWWDANHKTPYYSVWYGKLMLFAHVDDDEQSARDILSTTLQIGETSGVMDMYVLKLHPCLDKDGYISASTPCSQNMPFCVSQNPGDKMNGLPVTSSNAYNAQYKEGMNWKVDQLLELVKQQVADNNEIKSRLTALEEEEVPEVEEENILAGFLKDPQVKNLIVTGIAGLISGRGFQQPQAMAGIGDAPANEGEQRTICNQALAILWQHDKQLGSDLMKLAKVAQLPSKEGFEQILSYIRSLNV